MPVGLYSQVSKYIDCHVYKGYEMLLVMAEISTATRGFLIIQ